MQAMNRMGVDSGDLMQAIMQDKEMADLLGLPGMAQKFAEVQRNPASIAKHMFDANFRKALEKMESLVKQHASPR